MQTKVTFLSLLCIVGIFFTPLPAQESCYEQYLREHNMKILTAEDADDSYDELKKTVLAKQMYADSYLLMVDSIAQRVMITKVDGSYIADVHVALVDSTWYMWLSVDPLADKNIANTPYMYCNGNPIMLVDPMGLDTLHFNSDGTFNNRIVANGKHVGILHNEDGSSRTMRFVNQSDANRFCVKGSNEDFEMQAMGQKPLYGIHQVSAKTIYLMTARAGLLGRINPSLISKLLYAGLSGMQGGAADYNRLNEPFLKMGSNDGQVWAYIAEGSSYIQDSYNFGNMLWGQTMQQIGIPLGITLLGAHGYTLIDPKYHSFDSMDDQHSIIMGYLYSIIRYF